jgi:hypothetical protein
MPLAQIKFVPYEMKTSIIKIFSYTDDIPVGALINPYFKGEVHFKGMIQLLKIIDELQDAINFPQKSMTIRHFAEAKPPNAAEEPTENPDEEKRPIASFKLDILFRHNASWQGSVVWIEKGLQSEFRSALEFIFLVDSVLNGQAENSPGK